MEDQLHKLASRLGSFERTKIDIAAECGTYSFLETEGYDRQKLNQRLNALLSKCRAVASEAGLGEESIPVDLCGELLYLLAFPIPSIYLDGDGKWCFDWDDREDDKGVYCRVENEGKLLVVVDDGGAHLRLPCELSSSDPLRHLRYGLAQVFRD